MDTQQREDSDRAYFGTHSVDIDLRNLKICVACNDGGPDLDLGKETFDTLLQGQIDAATTSPSDLNGLIVLHAALNRWSAYAKRAIKLLEREISRPGYMEDC